jgi:hypothetical protein
MSFGTLDISTAEDWSPAGLLGLNKPAWPDQTLQQVRLGDIAFVERLPNGTAREGSLVIDDVQIGTGNPVASATERTLPAWTTRGDRGLTPDCVLVPPTHRLPALIVDESRAVGAYAARFIPVRPDRSLLLPEYLWALLSSASGIETRRRLVHGVLRPLLAADLEALRIPVPALEVQQRVAKSVRGRLSSLDVQIDKPAPSWSKTADLRDIESWDLIVKFRDLSVLDAGTPLGELAILKLSPVRSADFVDRPLPGWLPVIEPRSMRDPRATRWAAPERGRVAAGEIVLPWNPNLDAVVVHSEAVAGSGSIIVTPHSAHDVPRIVGSLNSSTGRDLRRSLSVNGLSLDPRRARRIPIIDGAEPVSNLTEPLDLHLERLLWP